MLIAFSDGGLSHCCSSLIIDNRFADSTSAGESARTGGWPRIQQVFISLFLFSIECIAFPEGW
jgi:hypothetical protein